MPQTNLAPAAATETGADGLLLLTLLAGFALLVLAGKAVALLTRLFRPLLQPLALLGTALACAVLVLVLVADTLVESATGPGPAPQGPPPGTSVVTDPGRAAIPHPPVR